MHIDISTLKVNDVVKVFDYGNDFYGEIVTISDIDTYTDSIIYTLNNVDHYMFSNQGYFVKN